MSIIIYPTELHCPNYKTVIKLDYEGRLNRRYGQFAATDDLLIMNIAIPHSYYSAQDTNKNKQNINYSYPHVLICK